MAGKIVILVVERDPFMRQAIEKALEGFELIFSEDGIEGLRMAKELKPDLIIVEPMIPRLDGFQLCSRLKSDEVTKEIPVLFLTVLSAKERAEQVNADGFMLKPLNRRGLREKVKRLLGLGYNSKQR